MLAIGRALVTGPDLMILDEPSEGLAPVIIERLEAVLKHVKASGTPILLVEQNYHLATRLADYVYVLSQRLVQFVGKVALSVKQPVKIRPAGRLPRERQTIWRKITACKMQVVV